MNRCKNCDREFDGNFCSNCGQPTLLKRIDWSYIKHELGQVLQLERGIFYTTKALALSPGISIREYILVNRSRLVKPAIFIILTSLIYTLITHYLNIDDLYFDYDLPKDSTTNIIFKWIQENYGYANIIMGLFIAFWIRVFYRKLTYNYYEILVLLCFVMGFGMLLFSIFAITEVLTSTPLMQYASLAGVGYISWAVGNFFGRGLKSYLKAFAAYILGTLSFAFTALLAGTIIDRIVMS